MMKTLVELEQIFIYMMIRLVVIFWIIDTIKAVM